jgi:DNA-directed RNA polymerase subunit RPC12/RpoP
MLKCYNFEIQVTCPGCNTSHPVSSLLANETCENCGKELIMNNLIQETFEAEKVDRLKVMNGFLTGNINTQKPTAALGIISQYKMICWSHPASCELCKTRLDESDIRESITNKKPIYCKKCNHPMPVRPADDEIKQFHPKAIGVINDSRGFDANPDVVETKNQTIVFGCMTCGAGLKLDKHSERLTKCTYCDNENYLPDAIWNRLHPYKEPERIYLILDLEESDMKESLDYFFTTPKGTPILYIQLLANHFPGFIVSYFTLENAVFLSDSVKCWWKLLLNSKYERTTTSEDDVMDFLFKAIPTESKVRYIEDAKNYFFLNFRNEYSKLIPELKEFIAANILEIPDDIRDMLSKDVNESVRAAIAKYIPPEKPVTPSEIQVVQPNIPPIVEEKKGFFKKLFG